MEIPEVLVERTLEGMLEQYGQFLKSASATGSGETRQEEFRADLKKKMRDRAQANVRANLVMYKLTQVEQLAPTAEEIEAEAAHHNVDPEKEHEYIYNALQNKKVFQFLEKQGQETEK
jgi:FKBP-type peptidyl-prolyl cis-trans isomerase (trigger factor)